MDNLQRSGGRLEKRKETKNLLVSEKELGLSLTPFQLPPLPEDRNQVKYEEVLLRGPRFLSQGAAQGGFELLEHIHTHKKTCHTYDRCPKCPNPKHLGAGRPCRLS
jgi:hypothetical protein